MIQKQRFVFDKSIIMKVASMALATLWGACGPMEPNEPLELAPLEFGQLKQGLNVYDTPVAENGLIEDKEQIVRHMLDLVYGGNCVFETSLVSLQDSYMTLRNSSNTVLREDDDGGPGLASRIEITLVPGRYYVDVRGYNTSQIGTYVLNISCTNPVFFHENFYADGDPVQCNLQGHGHLQAGLGEWTQPIFINTDNRGGGCFQQFGITDPTSLLPGLTINVDFYSDGGDPGQCNLPGLRSIPVSSSTAVQWSSPYRIDTDNRGGGCWQVFSLNGRSDVALEIDFQAAGDAGQCGNTGTYLVTAGTSASFRIDTDGRSGGCTQRFRLRRL